MRNRDESYSWRDVMRLLNDLKADGYGVNDVETSTSAAVDGKTVTIEVEQSDSRSVNHS